MTKSEAQIKSVAVLTENESLQARKSRHGHKMRMQAIVEPLSIDIYAPQNGRAIGSAFYSVHVLKVCWVVTEDLDGGLSDARSSKSSKGFGGFIPPPIANLKTNTIWYHMYLHSLCQHDNSEFPLSFLNIIKLVPNSNGAYKSI